MGKIKASLALMIVIGVSIKAVAISAQMKSHHLKYVEKVRLEAFERSRDRVDANGMSYEEVREVLKRRLAHKQYSEEYIAELAKHLVIESDRHRFEPAEILSLIYKESSFRPQVHSFKGAVGLMQILPPTARYISLRNGINEYQKPSDLHDPFVNITVGINYLAYLRARFADSKKYLAAYNLGPGTVGIMVKRNRFRLGAVKNYVYGIQRGIAGFKKEGKRLALIAAQ